VSRHRTWLHDAGFDEVSVLEPLPNAQVIRARRSGADVDAGPGEAHHG
jgi:hypothetical protein